MTVTYRNKSKGKFRCGPGESVFAISLGVALGRGWSANAAQRRLYSSALHIRHSRLSIEKDGQGQREPVNACQFKDCDSPFPTGVRNGFKARPPSVPTPGIPENRPGVLSLPSLRGDLDRSARDPGSPDGFTGYFHIAIEARRTSCSALLSDLARRS